MNESILNTIKKMNNIDSSDTSFDVDLRVHINQCIYALSQIGVTSSMTAITGAAETWYAYLGNVPYTAMIIDYIYLKTKTVFDPSGSSTVQKAFEERASELEWRISTTVDRNVIEDE